MAPSKKVSTVIIHLAGYRGRKKPTATKTTTYYTLPMMSSRVATNFLSPKM